MRPATTSPMRAHAVVCLCALFVAIVLTSRVAEAQPEGGPCDPEPTDQTIQFGDLAICNINPPLHVRGVRGTADQRAPCGLRGHSVSIETRYNAFGSTGAMDPVAPS